MRKAKGQHCPHCGKSVDPYHHHHEEREADDDPV